MEWVRGHRARIHGGSEYPYVTVAGTWNDEASIELGVRIGLGLGVRDTECLGGLKIDASDHGSHRRTRTDRVS